MNVYSNRLESFHIGPKRWSRNEKSSQHAETFAKAGFYFVRKPKVADSVRCFLCDIELSHWKEIESPMENHAHTSPDCPWVILHFPDATHSLSVNQEDPDTYPKSTRMRDARFMTFKKGNAWPPSSTQQTQISLPPASKLADAGFYYSPTRDQNCSVTCPYCRLSLTNMDRTTRPSARHRELKPGCPFFKPWRKPSLAGDEANHVQKPMTSKLVRPDETSKDYPMTFEDSVWNIEKAYKKQEHVHVASNNLLTYSKKQRKRMAPILPPELLIPADDEPEPVEPVSTDTRSLPSKSSKQPVPSKTRLSSDKGKGKAKAVPSSTPTSTSASTSATTSTPSSSSSSTTTTTRKSLSLSRNRGKPSKTAQVFPAESSNKQPSSVPIVPDVYVSIPTKKIQHQENELDDETDQEENNVDNNEKEGLRTPPRQIQHGKVNSLYECPYYSPMEEDNDLMSLTLSPIRFVGEAPARPPGFKGILHSTPITHPKRFKRLDRILDLDQDQANDHAPAAKRPRPMETASPPHPTFLPEQVDKSDLTKEQLDMTVEEFIRSRMNDSIACIKQREQEMIAEIQGMVDGIRRDLQSFDGP